MNSTNAYKKNEHHKNDDERKTMTDIGCTQARNETAPSQNKNKIKTTTSPLKQ